MFALHVRYALYWYVIDYEIQYPDTVNNWIVLYVNWIIARSLNPVWFHFNGRGLFNSMESKRNSAGRVSLKARDKFENHIEARAFSKSASSPLRNVATVRFSWSAVCLFVRRPPIRMLQFSSTNTYWARTGFFTLLCGSKNFLLLLSYLKTF